MICIWTLFANNCKSDLLFFYSLINRHLPDLPTSPFLHMLQSEPIFHTVDGLWELHLEICMWCSLNVHAVTTTSPHFLEMFAWFMLQLYLLWCGSIMVHIHAIGWCSYICLFLWHNRCALTCSINSYPTVFTIP